MPTVSAKPSRAHLILPVVVAGIAVGLFAMLVPRASPAQSEHEVVRRIREIALHKSTEPGVEDGGVIGPWHVCASDIDHVTGEFREFKLSSGGLSLGARTATLRVDPDSNTFSFDLTEVVFLSIPRAWGREAPTTGLTTLARYELGPAPYGVDIVPDRAGAPPSAIVDGTSDAPE